MAVVRLSNQFYEHWGGVLCPHRDGLFSLYIFLSRLFPQRCILQGWVRWRCVTEVRAAEFKSEPQPLQGQFVFTSDNLQALSVQLVLSPQRGSRRTGNHDITHACAEFTGETCRTGSEKYFMGIQNEHINSAFSTATHDEDWRSLQSCCAWGMRLFQRSARRWPTEF